MGKENRHYNIPIFIPHLSCPFKCIFCDQTRISAHEDIPDSEKVKDIIDQHLETIAEDADVEVAFFGGTFTAIDQKMQEEYLAAVTPYILNGRIKSIRLSTRPDFIDEEELSFLKKYGVNTIELGVQSLDNQVLWASRRGYTEETVYKSAELIKKSGFKLGIQLMIGLPEDNMAKDLETTQKVISINPDMVRIYPTIVIAGTALDYMMNRGKFVALSLMNAVEICKEMFLLFQFNNINVIRMGLQPSDELLKQGTVTAGPFHSSFGELVEQEVFKEQLFAVVDRYFAKEGKTKNIDIYVNFRDVSKLTGKKKNNILSLQSRYAVEKVKIHTEKNSQRDWIAVSSKDNEQYKITRNDFIYSRFA